jgi:CheY-like chemotaxis protein
LARKILLADDSVTAQNMGRKILADAGYEVITVNNGSAALKKIAEHKPDLIILDVYMPGYSGLEVCQRLKEAQETSRVPVLLTVGKLEPFKPEEAKRVRADGFIVKPFEASELLSALSKLEDKIVPRAEASKPGRFARATAALDEGRYDKTVAIDEESGWKNRISFPSKKKEKNAAEDGDDPGIYNAMNKDLRTVVERKPVDQPHEAKVEEARVDLGALAPEGLPKDVTPEEIAALAAAAAQVKGKSAENRHAEPAPVEARTDQKVEAKENSQPLAERVQELPQDAPQEITAAAPAVATFAEQKSEEKSEEKSEGKSEEKSEASASKSSDSPKEAAPSPADIMAAIAGLEVDAVASPATSSGNGSWSHGTHGPDGRTADEPATIPATMAVAAGAESIAAASRWTAVSVALAPEEAAISLELEMQKAYAAFAAAEAGHAGVTTASPETQSKPAEPAAPTEISSQAEAVAPGPVVSIPAIPAPEAAEALSAVANAATDAISAAVKELEAVAASYLAQRTPVPAEPEPAPVEKAEAAPQIAPEAPQTEARVEDNPPATAAEPAPEPPKLETAGQDAPEIKHEEAKSDVPVREEASAPTSETTSETPETQDTTVAAFVNEVLAEQSSASQISDRAAVASDEPAARGPRDMAKKESEMAETTAAAWANWRQTRESGDLKGASAEPSRKENEEEASSPADAAAMAVAAGAEKAPEESSIASPSDAEGIASIVDSVLADMRPKIFEEISRKMGKKK